MVGAEVGGCWGGFVGVGREACAAVGFAFSVPGAVPVGGVSWVDAEGDGEAAWC